MIGFLLRRTAWMFVTVWAVFSASWWLANMMPGTPFTTERELAPEIKANMMRRYRLDRPLHERYWYDLGKLAAGDLGLSLRNADFTVNEIASSCWPVSAALGLVAMAIAVVLGMAAGVVSATSRGSFADFSLMTLATLGIALPTFVIAGFAVLLASYWLRWLPPAGWGSLDQLVLPAFCLGAPYAAYIARIARTGLLDVLNQDFVRTAKAKGLSGAVVIFRHAMPTAIMPVVSFLGPAVAGIITGSLVVEKIFAIPGLGMYFVESAVNNDTPLALGLVVLYTVLLYVMNTLVDVAYTVLDPRVEWG